MASFGLAPPSSSSSSPQQQQQSVAVSSVTNVVGGTASLVDASTPWVAAADGNLNQLQTSLSMLNLPIAVADSNGYTLLQAAASYGQVAIVQWLLQQAASTQGDPSTLSGLLQAVDGDGDSALHYASTVSVAELLIQHGSSTQIQNAASLTPLQAKQQELQELQDDEDGEGFDEDDEDVIQLQRLVTYLSCLQNEPQGGQGHS